MTNKIAIFLLAALLSNATVASTPKSVEQANRLPPLTESSAHPELRMWSTVALVERGVKGVVVTPGLVRFYTGNSIAAAELVESIETAKADAILGGISDLAEHDGARLSCARIKDGWSLDVEGISTDGHFTFTAHVPNLCTEGPAKEVFGIHEQLWSLRDSHSQ